MGCQSIASTARLPGSFFPLLAKLSAPVRSKSLLCFLEDFSWALVAVAACLIKVSVFNRLYVGLLLDEVLFAANVGLCWSFGLLLAPRAAPSKSVPAFSCYSRRKIFCLQMSFCFLNCCIYDRIETTFEALIRLLGLA